MSIIMGTIQKAKRVSESDSSAKMELLKENSGTHESSFLRGSTVWEGKPFQQTNLSGEFVLQNPFDTKRSALL